MQNLIKSDDRRILIVIPIRILIVIPIRHQIVVLRLNDLYIHENVRNVKSIPMGAILSLAKFVTFDTNYHDYLDMAA